MSAGVLAVAIAVPVGVTLLLGGLLLLLVRRCTRRRRNGDSGSSKSRQQSACWKDVERTGSDWYDGSHRGAQLQVGMLEMVVALR